ncbi:MAG: hypothetical protein PHV18_14250 [Lachnospiraceae bacterium]|nr:hypothetical protein [Lachnospiraceae bacterium]
MKEESERDFHPTDFDYLMMEPHLQMMKAALPYMPPSQQRAISMMIKLQELNRTRSLFQQGELSAMGVGSAGTPKASPLEMLQAMKPYAGPRERELIEMFENMQIMVQAMQTQS